MSQGMSNKPAGPELNTASGTIQQQIMQNRIFDQMVEALVYIDADLKICFANRSFYDLFGYTEKDILGQHIHNLGSDEDFANKSSQEIARIIREKGAYQGQVLRRAKGGHYIPVLVTASVAEDEHGNFDGFIGTYQDLRKIRQPELRLRNGLTECISALASAIEERDLFKSKHHLFVNDLCVAMALEMGKPTDFIEGLSLAAVLHDVGKLYVPSEILNYAGSLTSSEMSLVRTHCQVGYDMLKNVDLPWPVADIVLQHHERLDGSGYPNQLIGDEILIGARILAVADVVESMFADRPNRPGFDVELCLEEIEDNRGILYEPDAVNACLEIIRKGRHSLKRRYAD